MFLTVDQVVICAAAAAAFTLNIWQTCGMAEFFHCTRFLTRDITQLASGEILCHSKVHCFFFITRCFQHSKTTESYSKLMFF